jgi:hypothetical protein
LPSSGGVVGTGSKRGKAPEVDTDESTLIEAGLEYPIWSPDAGYLAAFEMMQMIDNAESAHQPLSVTDFAE